MSTAAPAEAAAPAPTKKGGAIKLILAVLVTAGLAGGGAFFYMSKKAAAAKPAAEQAEGEGEAAADEEHSEAKPDEKGEPKAKAVASADYFALSPQFVVNLNDPEAMRFLQAEVQVVASKTAAGPPPTGCAQTRPAISPATSPANGRRVCKRPDSSPSASKDSRWSSATTGCSAPE